MNLPRAFAVGVLCCFLVCGCAATPETAARPAMGVVPTYVVRPQDTLYGIAWRHNLDYRELAQWNHIGPDYKLVVGQVLVLRPREPSAARAPPPSGPAPQVRPVPPAGTPSPPPSPSPSPSPSKPGSQAKPTEESGGAAGAPPSGNWVWPTDRESAPRPVPGGGILVFGKLGQEVRAAAAGRVVYTGSGLRGYGNLIIVKHGDDLLSSYAHNRDLLVHEGQEVAAGQVIAHMGTGPHRISVLYFEIRVKGKPVDPLRYLRGR